MITIRQEKYSRDPMRLTRLLLVDPESVIRPSFPKIQFLDTVPENPNTVCALVYRVVIMNAQIFGIGRNRVLKCMN